MHDDDVHIISAAAVDFALVEAVQRLVPQLSSSASAACTDALHDIVASPCTTLLLARDRARGDRIIGMLTLAVFRIPTGVRAWIEDVVVDAPARGQGVGEALNREALRIARLRGPSI